MWRCGMDLQFRGPHCGRSKVVGLRGLTIQEQVLQLSPLKHHNYRLSYMMFRHTIWIENCQTCLVFWLFWPWSCVLPCTLQPFGCNASLEWCSMGQTCFRPYSLVWPVHRFRWWRLSSCWKWGNQLVCDNFPSFMWLSSRFFGLSAILLLLSELCLQFWALRLMHWTFYPSGNVPMLFLCFVLLPLFFLDEMFAPVAKRHSIPLGGGCGDWVREDENHNADGSFWMGY